MTQSGHERGLSRCRFEPLRCTVLKFGGAMRRREFIKVIAGWAAAAWPLAARAQQDDRLRRIGVLMPLAADDPEAKARLAAFAQGLRELGWIDGRNVRVDMRLSAGNADEISKYAA